MEDVGLEEKIRRWVRERLSSRTRGENPNRTHPVERNLQEILELARLTVLALDELVEQIRVEDRNRYHYIREILPDIISFEEYSLAEYTFHLSGDRNPGIRLWLTSHGFQRVLQVLHFPDVLQWRVDRHGQRLHSLLASLDVSAPDPQVIGEVVSSLEGLDWQETMIRSMSEALLREVSGDKV